MLEFLIGRASEIYPRLAAVGERLRRGIEAAFRAEDLDVFVSGDAGPALPGSSLFQAHFLRRPMAATRAEDLADPEVSDVALREEILKLFLCLRGVHSVHGGGAASFAHTDAHVARTLTAYAEAARAFKKRLF